MASIETRYGGQGRGLGLILNHWCGVSHANIQFLKKLLVLDEVLDYSWPKLFSAHVKFCLKNKKIRRWPQNVFTEICRTLAKIVRFQFVPTASLITANGRNG